MWRLVTFNTLYIRRTLWRFPWSKQDERDAFGDTIAALIKRPRQTEWPRRPARVTYGVLGTKDEANRLDIRFDRAYYAQEFTAFGYDDVGAPEYRRFTEFYETSNSGDDLLAFVNHPGQAIIMPAGEPLDLHLAANCPAEQAACLQGSARASLSMLSYRLDGATYNLSADQEVDVVENEPFYPDFRAQLCLKEDCRALTPSASPGNLRLWRVPAGNWTMRIAYVQPYKALSAALALVGVMLGLSLWLASGFRKLSVASSRLRPASAEPHA